MTSKMCPCGKRPGLRALGGLCGPCFDAAMKADAEKVAGREGK